jgi:hypothetical protein
VAVFANQDAGEGGRRGDYLPQRHREHGVKGKSEEIPFRKFNPTPKLRDLCVFVVRPSSLRPLRPPKRTIFQLLLVAGGEMV